MPRLKSTVTGVVVSVGDDVAEVLDSEWVDADAAEETQRSETPDESWKPAELKSFAADHDPAIDLGGATTKPKILAAIRAALESEGGNDGSSEQ